MIAGDDRSALRWLLGYVRPHGGRLAAILLLSLFATGLGLAQPYLTKYLIDQGLLAGQFAVVLNLCALMLLLGLGSSLLGAYNRWQYIDTSARILHALRAGVYRHLQTLSPLFYARTRGGDLLARLDGDLAEVQRFAVDSLLSFVNGVLALVGAVVLMFSLSLDLSLLAFVLLPAIVLFLRSIRPKIETQNRQVRERASALTAFFFDSLSAMKTVQACSAEEREAARLDGLQDHYRRDVLRLQLLNYVTGAVPSLLLAAGTALVFVIGGWQVIQGTLTLGTLIAFSAYLARAVGPVQSLLGLYVAWQRARVSLSRVRELTEIAPAVTAPAKPVPLPAAARGELVFERVSFAYPGGPVLLREVDLRLPAGGKIGLIGPSGIGKSTLLDLLHRHYDPDAGRILLDGVDLRELSLTELRRRVAVVAQEAVLLPGTVLDNLRYAAPEADLDTVYAAARQAQVDSFVQALPQGYDTNIGSRGATLSGGQRQRIALARALLQNPLLLVLDEATSAVDADTESLILTAIDQSFAGRTRLLVSHRPHLLHAADLLLELQDGRLNVREPDAV